MHELFEGIDLERFEYDGDSVVLRKAFLSVIENKQSMMIF